MPRTLSALAVSVLALSIITAVPRANARQEEPAQAEAQAAADAAADPGPAPRVVVDQPVADLGSADRGQTVAHDFVLRNEGETPLEILEVRPACGCTVAEYDRVIPPGGTGKVHAELDTKGIEGAVAKSITVLTNDPANPRLQLTLRIRIEEYLAFNPGFARFVQGHGHPPGEVSNLLLSANFDGLEVEKVSSPYPFMRAEVRPARPDERRDGAAGNQYVLTVTVDYDEAPVGPLSSHVEVHTNHPRQPVARLPVSGFVRPLLAVTPPVADFGEIAPSVRAAARFVVRNFGADPVKLTGAELDLPGAESSIEAVEEGRSYKVELVLGEEMPKGPFDGQLVIRTDSPDEPQVLVQVKGTVL